MSLPLVSVVTPVYNGERHLEECLESVLAQRYPHWDHVVVDNASGDRSVEIARRYAAKDPRIRVVARTHSDLQRVINQIVDGVNVLRSSTVIALENQIPLRHLPLVRAWVR